MLLCLIGPFHVMPSICPCRSGECPLLGKRTAVLCCVCCGKEREKRGVAATRRRTCCCALIGPFRDAHARVCVSSCASMPIGRVPIGKMVLLCVCCGKEKRRGVAATAAEQCRCALIGPFLCVCVCVCLQCASHADQANAHCLEKMVLFCVCWGKGGRGGQGRVQ